MVYFSFSLFSFMAFNLQSKQPRPPSAAVRTPQRSSRPSLPKTPIASHGHSTPPVHKPRRRPLPEDDLCKLSNLRLAASLRRSLLAHHPGPH